MAAASHEQSAGVAQANVVVAQIDPATHHNAMLLEQAATATGILQGETTTLARTVSRFTLIGAMQDVTAAAGGYPSVHKSIDLLIQR